MRTRRNTDQKHDYVTNNSMELSDRYGGGKQSAEENSPRFVGTVRAVFGIDDALLDRIRIEVDNNGRHDVEFHVDIVGEEGEIVAEIDKVVQIRKRK